MKKEICLSVLIMVFALSSIATGAHLPNEEKGLGKDFIRLSECVPGHGFHWAKNPRAYGPPGSAKNPILLYYKGRLVGTEYVIPASIAEKKPPQAAMQGPELPLGHNLHKGEFAVDHVDLSYLPNFPPEAKDGIKAFTFHLWSVKDEVHEGNCK